MNDRVPHLKKFFRTITALILFLVFVAHFGPNTAQASPGNIVAFDMVGSSSLNLISHVNPFDSAFTSPADGFQKFQRFVSLSIPFAVLDDSLSIFPPDSYGIIKEGNTDVFFGVTDTDNPDNTGPVTATWQFDISGATGLSLSIDMGAMGDFEAASDYFTWEYSIDGGSVQTAFDSAVDEAESHTYTLAGGASFTLDDPMQMNGTTLSNELATFTTPLTGSGSVLTLTLTAQTNGGSEAFAFQNIIIEKSASNVVAFDMVGSSSLNLISHVNPFDSAFTSPADGFQKFQRFISLSIPFAVLDDSLSIFPPDSYGIIKEGNTDVFFGVTDTDNPDNTGPVTATWQFDISGATGLSLSIDMGAMGDFEAASDYFTWEYSIDGNPTETAFTSTVDETLSFTYTMAGGSSFIITDPMLINGTILSNDLATFTTPLTGSGSVLTLTLTARTDGGSEAFAFQNIIIEKGAWVDLPLFGSCGDGNETKIYEIQGNGPVSPYVGQKHVVEGVVVGDFQESDELRGFFIQEETTDSDGNPLTSDGIFVYDYGFGIDVEVGDIVRVKGTVVEYYGQTEITNITNLSECADKVGGADAATISMPFVVNLEAYEGMLVHIPQTLYVTDNYDLHRYGEITLSVGGVLDSPTNVALPSAPAQAVQDLNNLSQIQVDDGSISTYPNPPPYISPDGTLRRGDTIPELIGVVGFSFEEYEIHPTQAISFIRTNDRPDVPDVGGSIQVGEFNLMNYFTTIDIGIPNSGPLLDQEPRGADSILEFEHQRTKIIDAIIDLDAEILGLVELENAPDDTPIMDLVSGLNDVAGAGTYEYIATGPIGNDAIRNGLVYKPGSVVPVGSVTVLDSSVDPTFNDEKNRPVLAQTFMDIETGDNFTVAVAHLKSKGSSCADVGDPDTGDLQGNCNLVRTNAATAIVNWLATDPTASGDLDYLILGDLNAYAQEDPIVALETNGYVDLIEFYQGLDYSYVYYGEGGYLDHAMASAGLTGKVTGAAFWHINADEPKGLDYNEEYNQLVLYTPEKWRSSDHDPLLVGLNFNSPPLVDAGADVTVDEGEESVFNISFTDEAGDTHTGIVDWGDGSPIESLVIGKSGSQWISSSNHTYIENGDFIITFTICDDEGACGSDTVGVNVLNVSPILEAIPDQTITSGEYLDILMSFTDPGILDTHTATINWGDGNIEPGSVSEVDGSGNITGSHQYVTPGTYTVTILVVDDDGGETSISFYVEVEKLTITIDIKPGSDTNPVNLKSNGVIPVAILSDDTFNATSVDAGTVRFGPADAVAVHVAVEDIDDDGTDDMILHFRTQEASLSESDTEAILTGQTTEGIHFIGQDSVRIVPLKNKLAPQGKEEAPGQNKEQGEPADGKGKENAPGQKKEPGEPADGKGKEVAPGQNKEPGKPAHGKSNGMTKLFGRKEK